MKTTDELLRMNQRLVTALAENLILQEDKRELEQYIKELQTEIEELLEQLGE